MSSLYYMLLLFNKHTRRVISLFLETPGLIKVLRTFQSRCENSKQDYYYYYIHSSNIQVTTIQLQELDGSDFCQVPCFPAELASVSIQSILSGSCFMDSKSAVMQTLSECSGMEQCWNDCWNESWGKVSKQKKITIWTLHLHYPNQWRRIVGSPTFVLTFGPYCDWLVSSILAASQWCPQHWLRGFLSVLEWSRWYIVV